MKLRSIVISAALLIVTLSMAMAWPKSKQTITVAEPTVVGSVTLEPGTYIVEWSGASPNVQVSFASEDKEIVTVPATLESVKNAYEALITAQSPDGTHLLVEVRLRNSTLHFAPGDASSGD